MIFYKEKSLPASGSTNPEPNTKKELIQQQGFEFDVLLKCPEFYIIIISLLLSALTAVTFVPAHLTDVGFDPSFVASALSLLSIGLALCKPLVGLFYDCFGIKTAVNICGVEPVILMSRNLNIKVAKERNHRKLVGFGIKTAENHRIRTLSAFALTLILTDEKNIDKSVVIQRLKFIAVPFNVLRIDNIISV